MPRRTRAREVAMQVLYQRDANPTTALEDIERFLAGRLRSAALVSFARLLVKGVIREEADIDRRLEARAAHWRVARMAATDRAILRIALFELLHTDVPGPVAVDEAITLAKRYGSDASGAFVAGLLGSVLAERTAADSAGAVPTPRT